MVTALSPVIGYEKASRIAHYAINHDLTLKAAALQLGSVTEEEFDRVVDPAKMAKPFNQIGRHSQLSVDRQRPTRRERRISSSGRQVDG
jgi:fumarate hydratase class II